MSVTSSFLSEVCKATLFGFSFRWKSARLQALYDARGNQCRVRRNNLMRPRNRLRRLRRFRSSGGPVPGCSPISRQLQSGFESLRFRAAILLSLAPSCLSGSAQARILLGHTRPEVAVWSLVSPRAVFGFRQNGTYCACCLGVRGNQPRGRRCPEFGHPSIGSDYSGG